MENQAAKKDWVKNAIIVFLAIMLLLTLFSNTITNYSLPQVSIASAYTGQLTTSIRGTGNVTAGDAYTVKGKESRVIASCLVKKGDHVEKGDVIYALEDSESDELIKAEDDLAEKELSYYKELLTSGMDTNDAVKVNNGGASSFNTYIARINEINAEIEECKELILEKQQMLDTLAVGEKQITAAGLKRANDAGIQQKAAEIEKKVATYAQEDAKEAFELTKTHIKNALNDEKTDLNTRRTQITNDTSSSYLSRAYTAINSIYTGLDADKEVSVPSSITAPNVTDTIEVLRGKFNDLKPIAQAKTEYVYLINEAETALNSYNPSLGAMEKLDELNAQIAEIDNILADIDSMQYLNDSSYKEALSRYRSAELNSANAEINTTRITNSNNEVAADIASAKTYADADYKKYENQLKDLQEEKKDLLLTIEKSLSADKFSDDIARKKETIEKLRANAYGATIEAPVSGTIQTLAKVAGESIEPDKELIVIIPDGKDMSVNISVSNDQAKKVKLGDSATLSENLAWNYPDAVLVLEKMSDDTENPGKNTILTFSVSAQDLKVNQSISVVMNTETKDYPIIVPISAVHHDNSGDFIYKLTTKSSALGSRYYATKIGVKKLEQDDSNCAISVTDGELAAYDSVITSSNKTIEAGKLVRLSESSSN